MPHYEGLKPLPFIGPLSIALQAPHSVQDIQLSLENRSATHLSPESVIADSTSLASYHVLPADELSERSLNPFCIQSNTVSRPIAKRICLGDSQPVHAKVLSSALAPKSPTRRILSDLLQVEGRRLADT